jgi:hypothetical protein
MLQQGSLSSPVVRAPAKDNWADRRAYPRVPSTELGITRVKIRNRQPAALVDLSAGGALLEIPFQMPPEARVGMQLDTKGKVLEVPFQLLRCYVTDLRGGVKYHAAGAFDNLLNLEALAMRASSAIERMMIALERLERGIRKTAAQSRTDAQFHETVTDLMSWLRESESLDLVVLKLKARLTQTYRSLLIFPAATPAFDRTRSLECFGLTFKAKNPLSAHDRRFLKANAQLISMLEDVRRELRDEGLRPGSPQVLHTAAEWVASQSEVRPSPALPRPPAGPRPVAQAPRQLPRGKDDREIDYFSALKLDPAFV